MNLYEIDQRRAQLVIDGSKLGTDVLFVVDEGFPLCQF